MSYIGNPIISTDFPKDTFSGNGSTTAFTMSIAPASVNAVIVVVSGITQDPSTYTISGTTLTFSAAPPSGTSNISVRHLGVAGIPNTPSANSVGPSAINSSYALWNLSGSDVNYTAGKVGIGTSTPTKNLHVKGVTNTNTEIRIQANASNDYSSILLFGDNVDDSGAIQYSNYDNHMQFDTNSTERMRIDSSGNLLVGTTAKFGTGFPAQVAVQFDDSTTQGMGFKVTGSASGADYVVFRNSSNTNIGSITRNGTSNAVLFNTTSDYRLKENVTPLTNALDKVSALKPVSWIWKDCDGAVGEGFIAHEVQEIVPNAVNGAKDAVDEEGNIKPQGMDASYLVATLTAAIQEQQAMIEELKTRVSALETV